MRGRVIAILLAITLGGTPIGAPIVGWVADRFGPRWALGVAAAAGLLAAAIALIYLLKHPRPSADASIGAGLKESRVVITAYMPLNRPIAVGRLGGCRRGS